MELYAKGQLSFLILNCLLERDFYGLDIITEIKGRTSGNVDLKKPSVYSNLTRMEKQGQVSSYMRSSELGPNRRYYSITEKGRQTYQELKEEFERNHIDVFKDFRGDFDPIELVAPAKPISHTDSLKSEGAANNYSAETDEDLAFNDYESQNETEEVDTSDFFDFSSLNKPQETASNKPVEEFFDSKEEKEEVVCAHSFKEEDLTDANDLHTAVNNVLPEEAFKESVKKETVATDDKKEETFEEKAQISVEQEVNDSKVEKKNDAVFLSKEASEYNQRIYDISKDINRYRRRRSFAEDQIAISVEAPLRDSEERTKQKVEEFKSSLIENKNKYASSNRMTSEEFFSMINREDKVEEKPIEVNEKTEQLQDDGIFITSRMNERDVLRARKIEPPRLKIEPVNKDKLPPPKRDVTIDPSHKEIISRLYAKSKTSQGEEFEEEDNILYDYDDLKGYYGRQNIKFNSYERHECKPNHNTNKLGLISSIIVFLVFAALSGVSFVLQSHFGLLNAQTSFLFILLPALCLVEVIVQAYNLLRHTSWEPNPMIRQLYLWGWTILGLCAVVGLNFAFGFNGVNFADFATTLIIPVLAIIMLVPFRYYVKRTILIKYWR